jgi:hypothetical protein
MGLRRAWALCGVVGMVLVAVSITVIAGNTPDDKASAAKVLAYYRAHENSNKVAAVLVLISAVLVVLFAARLREALRADRLGDGLAPMGAFGGGVILGGAFGLMAAVHIALVNAADHHFAAAAQTLNVFDNYDFIMVFVGIGTLLLAAGIATVRQPVLPRWLGWVAIVFGVVSVAGPAGFIGVALGAIWIIVVGIMLATRRYVTVGTPDTVEVETIVVDT